MNFNSKMQTQISHAQNFNGYPQNPTAQAKLQSNKQIVQHQPQNHAMRR